MKDSLKGIIFILVFEKHLNPSLIDLGHKPGLSTFGGKSSVSLRFCYLLNNGCYFPIQKLENIFPSNSSLVTSPVINPK